MNLKFKASRTSVINNPSVDGVPLNVVQNAYITFSRSSEEVNVKNIKLLEFNQDIKEWCKVSNVKPKKININNNNNNNNADGEKLEINFEVNFKKCKTHYEISENSDKNTCKNNRVVYCFGVPLKENKDLYLMSPYFCLLAKRRVKQPTRTRKLDTDVTDLHRDADYIYLNSSISDDNTQVSNRSLPPSSKTPSSSKQNKKQRTSKHARFEPYKDHVESIRRNLPSQGSSSSSPLPFSSSSSSSSSNINSLHRENSPHFTMPQLHSLANEDDNDDDDDDNDLFSMEANDEPDMVEVNYSRVEGNSICEELDLGKNKDNFSVQPFFVDDIPSPGGDFHVPSTPQ